MRRPTVIALCTLAGALAPHVAQAKPAFYRPREIVDPTALAAEGTAKLVAGIRGKNAAMIAEVLGTSFTSNGLWFPDPACAKRFGKPGELKGAEIPALARCLAQLRVQLTTRKSSLRDGTILTVDPGIELELAFSGNQLRWIGFPLQTGTESAIPTLTAQAFEALRTKGTTLLDAEFEATLGPERERQRGGVISAWLRICLDATGAVTKITVPQSPNGPIRDAFTAAAASWAFKPFEVRGAGVPACALTLLTYPSARAPAMEVLPSSTAPPTQLTSSYDFDDDDLEFVGGVVGGVVGGNVFGGPPPPPPPPPSSFPRAPTVPPSVLEQLRISGSAKISPDAAIRRQIIAASKTKVVASMKVCISERGDVSSVTTLKSSGFGGYDRQLTAAIRAWRFRTYLLAGTASAACTAFTFSYEPAKPAP